MKAGAVRGQQHSTLARYVICEPGKWEHVERLLTTDSATDTDRTSGATQSQRTASISMSFDLPDARMRSSLLLSGFTVAATSRAAVSINDTISPSW